MSSAAQRKPEAPCVFWSMCEETIGSCHQLREYSTFLSRCFFEHICVTASETRFCSRSCSKKGSSWLYVPVRKRGRSILKLLARLWPNVNVKSKIKYLRRSHLLSSVPRTDQMCAETSLMSHFYYFCFLFCSNYLLHLNVDCSFKEKHTIYVCKYTIQIVNQHCYNFYCDLIHHLKLNICTHLSLDSHIKN